MLDLKGHRLINTKSYAIIPLTQTTHVGPHISTVAVKAGGTFSDLLREFPSSTMPNFSSIVLKHGVEHYVHSRGSPISARAKCLPQDKLKLAKEKFDKLETLGIIHRSNSLWSSPLYVVPKSSSWRPCGDYCRLNNATTSNSV